MLTRGYQKSSSSILLTSLQLQEYLQMGRDKSRQIGEKAGARVQFGNSVRYNRKKIDAYIQSVTEDGHQL